MRNLKIIIEYEGTNYKGWQRQANGITIQEVIEGVISGITGENIKVYGSGRTDSGVHATGQVANFKSETVLSTVQLIKAMNSSLPEDIVVTDCEEVPDDFHSQYSAKKKTYIYRILNRPYPSALLRNTTWFRRNELDIQAMQNAVEKLVGEHDFRLFAHANITVKTTMRKIYNAKLVRKNDLIIFEIEANGFLKRMVRMITGALYLIGTGIMTIDQFCGMLNGRKSKDINIISAPARGLFLKKVDYI